MSVLTVVLPFFALILTGWLARRTGALGPRAVGEVNRYVAYLALPALLFNIVAKSEWSSLWQPGFIASFGLATGVVFALGLMLGRLRAKPSADAAIDGLNAAYANVGFMGIPLALAVFGESSLVPALMATLLTACVLFSVAIVIVEVSVQPNPDVRRMAGRLLVQLARNPLLMAPLLAALMSVLGLRLPQAAETFFSLLGSSAAPCALVGLGLFLAQSRSHAEGSLRGLGALVLLKLFVHPLAAWVLASQVFGLSATLTHCAVLLAALPTGTGPFMLTQYYRREGGLTASTILVSTVLSMVTLSAYLMAVEAWRPSLGGAG